MSYHCSVWDKTNKLESKIIHLKTLTHIQYEKSIQIIHTIERPNFFTIDKIFNDYITNHKKNYFCAFKCDFKLEFNNDFKPHNKTDFYHSTTNINFKRYLLYWIDYFTERGHKFSHVIEVNVISICDKRHMIYGC